MNHDNLEKIVLKRIDEMRKEMFLTANHHGVGSTQTLKCSQKLDRLINIHLRYFSNAAA
ncbi:aspartyl-phosphate phosphatase Spo0E family protein [Jeotgalibacillus salarius]|uniref:Aspartyl-phosphate phosphatase Spo0E family protein n=1 Tax=Jeotgalibacillus salarius TaxID=546023 RepID=A0A4Y8L9T8_9BACL|nr:aspartyl-phosphate phosphatase Spo0E family protein [Jeotgalibacillus salarius]